MVSARVPSDWHIPSPTDGERQRQIEQYGWAVRLVQDDFTLGLISKVFLVERPDDLGQGRDVRQKESYNTLTPALVWEIEAPSRNTIYQVKRDTTQRDLNALRDHGISVPRLATKRDAESDLCGYKAELNEKLLLHGTKPELVIKILHHGMNERYSGGLFGHGLYLAEDPEKIDQYCTVDPQSGARRGDLRELHWHLYGEDRGPPCDVFYAFLCQATLGFSVRTHDGVTATVGATKVFASDDMREFADIPRSTPPTPYHSLVAETGAKIMRHREFVLCDATRQVAKYLVAYQREDTRDRE